MAGRPPQVLEILNDEELRVLSSNNGATAEPVHVDSLS